VPASWTASRVLRRLLTACGYRDDQLDSALQRGLLAYALLHRYSNLARYLQLCPHPYERRLDALAERCWRFELPGRRTQIFSAHRPEPRS
jgi:hypothetical protein